MESLFTIQNELRYEVVRKLFEGGMGVVYEAEQHGTRGFIKRVAIKIIRQRYANNPEFVKYFIGEARLVADLIHTNIVQTYHLGETQGVLFMAMELIRGADLGQINDKMAQAGSAFPTELAVFITSRVARGLAYAHAKTDRQNQPLGLVHRDVNLRNIMVAFEGDVKLTDFGIAKARGLLPSNEGDVVAGKADYMSPEQANFQVTDHRSDIFSTGVVLAQLLIGYNIFHGESPEESMNRIRHMELPDFCALNPRIDAPLNQILRRCLAREPAERYAQSDELLYDLEYYIYHRGYGPTNETMGKFIRELYRSPDGPVIPETQTRILPEWTTLSSIVQTKPFV